MPNESNESPAALPSSAEPFSAAREIENGAPSSAGEGQGEAQTLEAYARALYIAQGYNGDTRSMRGTAWDAGRVDEYLTAEYRQKAANFAAALRAAPVQHQEPRRADVHALRLPWRWTGTGWEWFAGNCSRHFYHDPLCALCCSGSWVPASPPSPPPQPEAAPVVVDMEPYFAERVIPPQAAPGERERVLEQALRWNLFAPDTADGLRHGAGCPEDTHPGAGCSCGLYLLRPTPKAAGAPVQQGGVDGLQS